MISVVVPVFNEEESINAFFEELIQYVPKLDKEHEYIFIDDGSSDNTLPLLKQIASKNPEVRIFSFRKNSGKAEALTAGFQKAKGDIIVTLDADLQDQPSEIEKLLAVHKQGVDVVCGWRKNRKDKSRMKVISKMFNYIVGRVFEVKIHDYNCGLKLYTKEAAKSLRLYGGLHRFIPVLTYQEGFSVEEVAVHHEPRKYGKSKYSFSKIWKDLPDMFTMLFLAKYSKRPLHFFGIMGGGFTAVGLLIFAYLSIVWLMGEAIGRRPLLLVSVFLILVGIQIFFTGFLAELVMNLSMKEKLHFPFKYQSDKS